MATKLQFIRDISGSVSNNLPLSDRTETMNLVGSELTAFFDIPKSQAAYVVTFKYESNKLTDLTANRVNVDVRHFPYPASDNTYSNPLALLVPGGVRIYVSAAREDVDTDVLVHASIYEAPNAVGVKNLQQGEAELIGINVIPDTVSVPVGTTCQFTAYGFYSDDTFRDITTEVDWRVDLEEVATIGLNTGLLTGVAEGYALVDATLGSITSNEANVQVTASVIVSLAITPVNPSVDIGGSIQFTATATYSDGHQEVVYPTQWYTNDEEIVIINSNGLAEAISEGTAEIGCYITTLSGDIIAPPQTLTVTVAEANAYINYVPNGQFTVLNDYIKQDVEIDGSSYFEKGGQLVLSGYIDQTTTLDRYGNFYFYKYETTEGEDTLALVKAGDEGIEANPMYWMHHYCFNNQGSQFKRRFYEFIIGDILSFSGSVVTVSVWGKAGADSNGAINIILRQNYANGANDNYMGMDDDPITLGWSASKISKTFTVDSINRNLIQEGKGTFSVIIEPTCSNGGATDEFDVYFTNVQLNKTSKILPYQYIAADKLVTYKRATELPDLTSKTPTASIVTGDVLTLGKSTQGQVGVYLPPTLSYASPVPVGTMLDYLGEIDPPEGGWLNCCIGAVKAYNNAWIHREVSKTQFQRLFNRLNPTGGANTPMFGPCGCYVNNTGAEQSNQLRVYNQFSYGGSWLQDEVVGLNGAFTIERLSQSYNVTRITCPDADIFDPSTGYITRYTSRYDTYSGTPLCWYIVFIKDGNYAIHESVPVNSSVNIVYVYINSGDSASSVANSLSSAIWYIGFYLPLPNGYFSRCWDNGVGVDPDASGRNGRADSYSGDHVGTVQASTFGSHTHTKKVMNFWTDQQGVRGGVAPFGYVSSGPTSVASPDPLGTFALNETGGNETRGSNMSYAKIIKY